MCVCAGLRAQCRSVSCRTWWTGASWLAAEGGSSVPSSSTTARYCCSAGKPAVSAQGLISVMFNFPLKGNCQFSTSLDHYNVCSICKWTMINYFTFCLHPLICWTFSGSRVVVRTADCASAILYSWLLEHKEYRSRIERERAKGRIAKLGSNCWTRQCWSNVLFFETFFIAL